MLALDHLRALQPTVRVGVGLRNAHAVEARAEGAHPRVGARAGCDVDLGEDEGRAYGCSGEVRGERGVVVKQRAARVEEDEEAGGW